LNNHFHKLKVFKEDCKECDDYYKCDDYCEDEEKDCEYKYVRKMLLAWPQAASRV
jgi:hypothetical protein